MLRDTVVTAHLRWLEMRGHTPASVYARERALARMTAWLQAWAALNCQDGTADSVVEVLAQAPGLPQVAAPGTPGCETALNTARSGAQARDGRAETGAPTLLDATAADLAAWRESLATGPGATVNYVSHAAAFYDWAVTAGLRDSNPADGLPVPKLPRRLPRPVSEEDLMAALASAPDRVRPWLVLAGWAGLRAREIARLRRENVLDTATPPGLLIAADATKGITERLVPASSFVLAELRLAGLPPRGWVFRRADGRGGPNRPHLVSQLANRVLHQAGTGATLHQLRHRFLTLAYQQTHDLRLVQELAGHATPQTTAVYTAFDKGAAASAVESLPVPGRLRAVRRRESI